MHYKEEQKEVLNLKGLIKSSVALHVHKKNHKVDSVKLVKNVNSYVQLNYYESME